MNRPWIWLLLSMIVVLFTLTACEGAPPASPTAPPPPPSSPPPAATPVPTGLPATPTVALTAVAKTTTTATTAPKTTTPVTTATLPKPALTCPAVTPLPANAPLAARVNGQGILLDLYNRHVSQAQNAMVQNAGLDPKSTQGQETIKSLRQQVLDQLINDVVISQQAEREGIKVTDDDLNLRLAQMIQDAGSVEKLNEYLTKNQLTLGDLCSQVRAQLLGEAMLNRITAALPTQVPQVHARHILVASAQQAQAVRDQLRQGKDFAALAKQYSLDEASKEQGGDLGWFPKGVMDPQFEAVAFQLKPGETSDVVRTQFGFHVIRVDEKDNARALPPELLQNARQQAFLAWLQAVRETMKIERLVTS